MHVTTQLNILHSHTTERFSFVLLKDFFMHRRTSQTWWWWRTPLFLFPLCLPIDSDSLLAACILSPCCQVLGRAVRCCVKRHRLVFPALGRSDNKHPPVCQCLCGWDPTAGSSMQVLLTLCRTSSIWGLRVFAEYIVDDERTFMLCSLICVPPLTHPNPCEHVLFCLSVFLCFASCGRCMR